MASQLLFAAEESRLLQAVVRHLRKGNSVLIGRRLQGVRISGKVRLRDNSHVLGRRHPPARVEWQPISDVVQGNRSRRRVRTWCRPGTRPSPLRRELGLQVEDGEQALIKAEILNTLNELAYRPEAATLSVAPPSRLVYLILMRTSAMVP